MGVIALFANISNATTITNIYSNPTLLVEQIQPKTSRPYLSYIYTGH